MTEMLAIYEPTERFGTMTPDGVVRVWEVLPDGSVIEDSDLRHSTHRRLEQGEEVTP